MKKMMMVLVIAGVLIAWFFVSYSWRRDQIIKQTTEESSKQVLQTSKILKIGEITLNVEVANTEVKRIQGLSGKEKLDENEGMLFVFDKEGYYGIWMKDMNFPIDIAWLDENKKITHIENAVSPETYPKVLNSPISGIYVLETNASFFENHKIKIGDVAEF